MNLNRRLNEILARSNTSRERSMAEMRQLAEVMVPVFAVSSDQLYDQVEQAVGAVNLADAKTHLSELVSKAESGEETVITRRGQPVARLAPTAANVARGDPRV